MTQVRENMTYSLASNKCFYVTNVQVRVVCGTTLVFCVSVSNIVPSFLNVFNLRKHFLSWWLSCQFACSFGGGLSCVFFIRNILFRKWKTENVQIEMKIPI